VPTSLPTSELDRLFAAPLETFVAERKRLAGQLKAAGHPREAKELQGTPRPSWSAWTVNQLARQEAALLKRLAEVTERLETAQRKAAGTSRSHEYSEALIAHREILRELRGRAEEILATAGQTASPPILERVVRNLRVGIAGRQTRDLIENGRLVRDLAEQDFVSLLARLAETPGATDTASSTEADQEHRRPARADTEHRPRAHAEAERARAARAAAEGRIRLLRREAETARATLDQAETELAKARQALADAEERVRRAKAAAERAETERGAAEAALTQR
jgi:hypothetical protein